MKTPFHRHRSPWQRAVGQIARLVPPRRAKAALGVVGAAVAATAASAAASNAREASS